MTRITLTAAALLLLSCGTQIVFAEQAEQKPEPISSEVLLQASSSWKGDQYKYPQGLPLITVKTILFQPGAKSKPHSHEIPGAAFIQEGELLCEVPVTGLAKRFVKGVVLPTTFKNDLHTCENTGTEVAKVLVFYAGAVGVPTSYYIQK
ncbi:lipoprotein, putative [Synechococcus sp. CC9311]|nr:lipoprotein, putative [Synechococcus sp. CC9311]